MKKRVVFFGGIIVLLIVVAVVIWDFFGLKYVNKVTADKYRALITDTRERNEPTLCPVKS